MMKTLIRFGETGNCEWELRCGILTISGNGPMGNYVEKSINDKNVAPWGRDITKVVIEEGVTSIGNCSFDGCASLASITIPDSVTEIGSGAFGGCTSLTSVTIPDSVTSIGIYAFAVCTSLTSITIPSSVTKIGRGIFFLCNQLLFVELPDNVTSIGDYAFESCSSLISINIPDSVTSIGSRAFRCCKYLTAITIPNSVKSIGERAFEGCKYLTIRAYEGSYAEQYAEENGIKYMIMPKESHVTCCYMIGLEVEQAKRVVREYIPFLGKKVPVMAYAYGNDGINEGLAVEIDPSAKVPYYGAKVPHITLAVNKVNGGKAVNTAYLDFSRKNFTNFIITGKIGLFMEDGTVAYSIEDAFGCGHVIYIGIFFKNEDVYKMLSVV